MTKPKVGDVVEVVFLDHVEDGDEPIEFAVYGVMTALHRTHLVVASWIYSDRQMRDDDNSKTFCILCSAIKTLKKLTP